MTPRPVSLLTIDVDSTEGSVRHEAMLIPTARWDAECPSLGHLGGVDELVDELIEA